MAHEDDAAELAPVAPELFVPDVPEAARFYETALGFRIIRCEPDFAIVSLGECVIMLAAEAMYGSMGGENSGQRGQLIDIRLVVPDVDAMYRRAKENRVAIVHDIGDRPYGLRDFILRDPHGFRLRFASPLR